MAFAAEHNLRLVVKNTGHDWYGRSTAAGSLLLWTHQLKDIRWHDRGFVPSGCGAEPVPAVTVGAGVQFAELYSEAMTHNKVVMGGTCDSVGVAGACPGRLRGPRR